MAKREQNKHHKKQKPNKRKQEQIENYGNETRDRHQVRPKAPNNFIQ